MVAFHRAYKRLGVEKGNELRVLGVDRRAHTVELEGKDGRAVDWNPNRLAARTGGVEIYRTDEIELRAGDRIRWTRNDAGLGLVNSGIAEVAKVDGGRVTFRLEDGRMLDLAPGDPQLRHIDRAWASTVHAFQGRTVDAVIAAMEANHPHLTTQKSFYVEIYPRARPRRARHRRQGGAEGTARSRDRRAHRGARSGRVGAGEGPRSGAGRGPEQGSRERHGGIAAAGANAGAGIGAGPRAEGSRSRPRAVEHTCPAVAEPVSGMSDQAAAAAC